MMSKGWIGRIGVGLVFVTLGACRMTGGEDDVVSGTDATRDMNMPRDMGTTDTPSGSDVPSDDNMMMMDGGADARSVTIRQIQDLTDPAHPPPSSHVVVNQSGMIALTPRVLIGSSSGAMCRFATWVGSAAGGDFSAVQVQELITAGDAGSCFNTMARQIPADLAPGDQISLIDNATYSEFCAGPSGMTSCTMHNWEQAQLFGPRTFTRTGMGAAPMATVVPISDIAQMNDGSPGPRTLALEATLLRVNNVRIDAVIPDGSTFADWLISDPSDTSFMRRMKIIVENFRATSCVRTFLMGHSGMTIESVTGILVPDRGRWSLRIRDEHDIGGLNCAAVDGGTPMDGG